MIYQDESIFYLLSVLVTILIGFRLYAYLRYFSSALISLLATLAILLHPLSIDAFLAPNLFAGSLAFYLFVEAQLFLRKEKPTGAILLLIFSSMCNITYCLFPVFIALKHLKVLKKYFFITMLYTTLLIFYLWKHRLLTTHNPFIFFTHYIQNVLIPISLSVVDYSTYPFSASMTALTIIFILLIIWRQKSDQRSKNIFPLLFLPLIGCLLHQWGRSYQFWDEVIFSPSNYFCLTFAFIVMLAIHLPRMLFIVYFIFTLMFSYDWALEWNPYSKVLRQSISNLPLNYKEKPAVLRVLAWQFFYEGKKKEGEMLLQSLVRERPMDENLKKDLKSFSR